MFFNAKIAYLKKQNATKAKYKNSLVVIICYRLQKYFAIWSILCTKYSLLQPFICNLYSTYINYNTTQPGRPKMLPSIPMVRYARVLLSRDNNAPFTNSFACSCVCSLASPTDNFFWTSSSHSSSTFQYWMFQHQMPRTDGRLRKILKPQGVAY